MDALKSVGEDLENALGIIKDIFKECDDILEEYAIACKKESKTDDSKDTDIQ